MKEINEIMNNLKDYCETAIDNKIVLCNRKEMMQLLDYIHNLIKEKEKYKKYTNETFLYTYEELQDKVINLQVEIKTLNNNISNLHSVICKKQNNINSLNNIINKIEKESYLGMLENQNNNDYAKGLYSAYHYINNKLNELKEDYIHMLKESEEND